MHIFIHIVILFIYVYVLLLLNIPQIALDDNIKFKLYIFGGIFLFEFIVNLIITVYKKCIVDIGRIVKNSLYTALVATVAYSVYNDLVWTSSSLIMDQTNKHVRNMTITVIITAFIALGYFMEIALTDQIPGLNDCINTIYPAHK